MDTPLAAEFDLYTASAQDFNELCELRYIAMKESAEANGLFDHDLARSHFAKDFQPEKTQKIMRKGELLGFFVVLKHEDHLYLDMLYLVPKAQGQGIGAQIIKAIQANAQALSKPIRLDALRISRSNAFYLSHGFQLTHSENYNNFYEWRP